MPKDLYVVTKYIMAKSATEAIQLEKEYDVDSVFIDQVWKENQMDRSVEIKGFKVKKKHVKKAQKQV